MIKDGKITIEKVTESQMNKIHSLMRETECTTILGAMLKALEMLGQYQETVEELYRKHDSAAALANMLLMTKKHIETIAETTKDVEFIPFMNHQDNEAFAEKLRAIKESEEK